MTEMAGEARATGAGRVTFQDRLLGPGATRAETGLALGAGALFAILAPATAAARGLDWSVAQLMVAAVLAFDLFGGVSVNASAAGRRHYHAPGRRARDHVAFVAAHVLHVMVVVWLFRGGDWAHAALVSALLLGSAALVLATPQAVRTPAALLAYAAAVFVAVAVAAPTPGMEWFVPVLFLKLLVAYLLGTVSGSADGARGAS